jgi:hypothetical protein
MPAGDPVAWKMTGVLADVVDVAHLRRIGVDLVLAVGDHRAVIP